MSENDINSIINLENFEDHLPQRIIKLLPNRDAVTELLKVLPEEYPLEAIAFDPDGAGKTEQHRLWELIGYLFKNQRRFYEAIQIFSSLYRNLTIAQSKLGKRLHKGVPLVNIHECYKGLNFPVHAKRYLMLTLCEDAITSKGKIDPNKSGVYSRLVSLYGLPNKEFLRYQDEIYSQYREFPDNGLFPEWILQDLDNNWMTEIPSSQEAQYYTANTGYIEHLYNNFGSGSGEELERVADYLLSCIAGFRTARRAMSHSTDYDVVCSLEGINLDFRAEIGRYFICECKDWDKTADFSTIAKFCRVLDSAKCKFGIIFSKNGISGDRDTEDPKFASREILKIYQDRGMAIIVVDSEDILKVKEGLNFTVMLRSKYDEIRLDLKNQLYT